VELSGLSFRSVLDSVELASSSPVEIRGGICFSAVPFEAREVDLLVFEKTNSSQVPAKLLVSIDLVEIK
jgi:hypothetical protein